MVEQTSKKQYWVTKTKLSSALFADRPHAYKRDIYYVSHCVTGNKQQCLLERTVACKFYCQCRHYRILQEDYRISIVKLSFFGSIKLLACFLVLTANVCLLNFPLLE